MDRQELSRGIAETFRTTPSDMTIFDMPLVGVARASDEMFASFRAESIIGTHYMLPGEWLEGAVSVVSVFFPFSEHVRRAERQAGNETSPEWLYGRVEGQEFINTFTRNLCAWLEAQGIRSCAPSLDGRFKVIREKFSSNWSERHAAYACGLGTFGLSRGLITAKGMAGRLSSVIVDAELEADTRSYTRYDEYCIMCGACVRRCPAHAITLEGGKNHVPCSARLAETRRLYAPRYGCGKCQTAVPCEYRRP